MDPELEAFITQAMLEVERDFSLPNSSLVDETPLPKIREGVRLKTMEVQLDQNFHGESARQPYQTFQGARTPQNSCRARRNHLTLHEWDRLTSGEVS